MSDTETVPENGAPWLSAPEDIPHDTRQVNIIVSASVCWVIAAFFVSLRFYTRGVIIHVLSWSDWCILLALIFAGATCAGLIDQAIHGSGRHVWDLDSTDTDGAIAWSRAAWYSILFYHLTLSFSKLSILLLYIHIFAFKWARKAGIVLLVVVLIVSVYMMLCTFTACIPLHSYWDFRYTGKKYCHPQSIWWSNTGLHMVTDFLIFMLPMPVVWTIKLPRRQKVILSFVFGFGFLVCFISILRLLKLIKMHTRPDPDWTYWAASLSYLTAVEVNSAIICASVMTLKPLLAKFWPRLLSSNPYSDSSSNSGGVRNRYRGSIGPGGPPTIGSKPSKVMRLSPVDEMMVSIERSATGGGKKGRGYVELEDNGSSTWNVDVEQLELTERGRTSGNAERGNSRLSVKRGKVRVDREVKIEVEVVARGAAL
ncbi:uncharacterized protein CTHT_0074290 [Thermochaetoides thermophila DSM 1495]|uniref:Rhodopsin domain-containing protein n=1 Tax=Chaetomium thermophilum (strain DSM 1495 / CBS 144.50 / IMI 039719) TaxID=759272 RepID=G0SI30_CHATD|nr:hypothetical protein CTHT_0074290 [Thermochaetoides thermophila DSM 1495]EGS17100.1 hypothetical protein CTHT_0074290 [Thermochaetoides thermophila DSM 1495]